MQRGVLSSLCSSYLVKCWLYDRLATPVAWHSGVWPHSRLHSYFRHRQPHVIWICCQDKALRPFLVSHRNMFFPGGPSCEYTLDGTSNENKTMGTLNDLSLAWELRTEWARGSFECSTEITVKVMLWNRILRWCLVELLYSQNCLSKPFINPPPGILISIMTLTTRAILSRSIIIIAVHALTTGTTLSVSICI